ncbi:DeoR/GlpR transcriptional regulator [Rhodobacteraceae bacterium RKSG542]|uniref:DeoR/GlpR family DNA-binding transcription regulator n=1 Tax=Pseudovibrio flavus TaxID=2529854 RepID=UPI0012BD1881|nr:DeoR/GlpR family DNA-binding transcription regulator [Pseudovibrio flavus]MTI15715.1 DeoR/GlpR transcriptional regulator [Pseudovibrio flavus]
MADSVIIGNLRHEKLLKAVNESGYVSVEDLAELLDVSAQTIRRDIKKLSELKLLVRHHGGAGRNASVVSSSYMPQGASDTDEKEAIGAAIADYIPNNCSVFLTIGSTTEVIAKHLLKREGLRVITNSLRVANVLYQKADFNVMVPGGKLRSTNSGIVGTTALDFVSRFRVDYLITSCGSIEADGTMLDYDFNEVVVVQSMMKTARNILLAVDSSKYQTRAAVEVGHLKDVTALFTDQAPPPDIAAHLHQHDVKLKLVS